MNNVFKNRLMYIYNIYICISQKDKDSIYVWLNNFVRFILLKSFGIKVIDLDKKNEKQDLINFIF